MSEDFTKMREQAQKMRESFTRNMFVPPGERPQEPIDLRRMQEIFDMDLPAPLEKAKLRAEQESLNYPKSTK